MRSSPAAARTTLLVGIAGHRILSEVGRIDAGVDQALARIDELFESRTLALVSSLAEGADRVVAWRVLMRPGWRLIVPLPLQREEYVKDFHSKESRDEFSLLLARADEIIELQPAPTRSAAYEAAGLYVLDHCDVLIAVWDGNPAQGASGTAEVVAEARRRGMPIAWVHAGNRRPGTDEPTSLGEEQGTVTFENLPGG